MRRLFRGRYVGLPMHKLRNQNEETTAAVLMRYPDINQGKESQTYPANGAIARC